MKIRLLVQDEESCLDKDGLHYAILDRGIYKPVKLQFSFQNDWGYYTEWEDVEVVFQSGAKE